jgi:hypothetical protein
VAGHSSYKTKDGLIKMISEIEDLEVEPLTPRTSATGHLCIDLAQKKLLNQSPKFDN